MLKSAIRLWMEEETDMLIVSMEGMEVPVHRVILAALSPSMAVLLGSAPPHVPPTVLLPSCTHAAITAAIQLVYAQEQPSALHTTSTDFQHAFTMLGFNQPGGEKAEVKVEEANEEENMAVPLEEEAEVMEVSEVSSDTNTVYKCEICPHDTKFHRDLLLHYANQHFKAKINELRHVFFSGNVCLQCPQPAYCNGPGEQRRHIALTHGKVATICQSYGINMKLVVPKRSRGRPTSQAAKTNHQLPPQVLDPLYSKYGVGAGGTKIEGRVLEELEKVEEKVEKKVEKVATPIRIAQEAVRNAEELVKTQPSFQAKLDKARRQLVIVEAIVRGGTTEEATRVKDMMRHVQELKTKSPVELKTRVVSAAKPYTRNKVEVLRPPSWLEGLEKGNKMSMNKKVKVTRCYQKIPRDQETKRVLKEGGGWRVTKSEERKAGMELVSDVVKEEETILG